MREMQTLLFVWRLVRTLVLFIWSDTSTFVMRIFPNTPKLNAIMWPMMCIFPSSNAALHNTMHFEHWLWSEHWPCVCNKISIHHTWIGYGVIGMSKRVDPIFVLRTAMEDGECWELQPCPCKCIVWMTIVLSMPLASATRRSPTNDTD